MSTTYSYLKTTIDSIRYHLDEPSQEGKYSDTVLLRNTLRQSVQDVMHRVHNSSQTPVVCVYDFTIPTGLTSFTLPPCVGQVYSLRLMDVAFENESYEIFRRHDLAIGDYNFRIEGNSIRIKDAQTSPLYLRLYYVHTGSGEWHYGGTGNEGTAATSSNVSTFTFDSSPTIGVIDKRVNAYAGQVVRCFPSTGLIEERVVESYAFTSSVYRATLRNPFDVVDGSVTYEVLPPGPPAMWDAVVYNACIRLGTVRQMTQKQMAYFHDLNRAAMKTLLETVGNSDGRQGKVFTDRTRDTEDLLIWV